MTIPPLTEPITLWNIEIVHRDGFGGWLIKDTDKVYVSIKGYPTVRVPAAFRSKSAALSFLELNEHVLDRRCGGRDGFCGFEVLAIRQYRPVEFDDVVQLRTKRKRTRAER
jgi:hypothetical protein